MKHSELIQGVVSWNNRFPLDRWWRIKHNVSFMSPAHRESSFLYQLMEFEEDKLYLKEFQTERGKDEDKYIPLLSTMQTLTPPRQLSGKFHSPDTTRPTKQT